MNKDVAESVRVRRLIGSRSKRCFGNAARVIVTLPDYANAEYVEGMAICHRFPIEHGWVEKDGVIIDPTLPDADLVYFPGLRFKGQVGLAKAMRIPKPESTSEDLPIFFRFGWGGFDSPEFKAARVAACRYVGWEESAVGYESYQPRCEADEVEVG